MRVRLLVALLALTLVAAGWSQTRPARLELGFAGEFVAGAWNPLRLTLRDQGRGGAVLELVFDQGSLRRGEQLAGYRAEIAGGSGLVVFEDDVYVPAWRAFRWTVRRGASVVASGALDPRRGRLDDRPLDLLLSAQPGHWRAAYGDDARPVEVAAADLPRRGAAYDGVRSLLVDGTGAVPATAAVAAAAAAGVRVLLVGELPPSHAELVWLAPGLAAGLGAGEVRRVAPEDVARALAAPPTLDPDALLAAIAADGGPAGPTGVPQLSLLVAVGGYLLAVLALVRLGGAPGLTAALALALLASFAAWAALRPPVSHYEDRHRIEVGAGGLALALEARGLLSLPEGEVASAGALRPAEARPYRVDDDRTLVRLPRWGEATLLARPEIVPAQLRWDGVRLENVGRSPLRDVVVVGLGPQPDLPSGAATEARPAEEAPLGFPAEDLLRRLPAGTATARAGATLHVALPPLAGVQEASR